MDISRIDKFLTVYEKYLPRDKIMWLRERLINIDVDKNAIQRIESGERFVTDIELKVLADIFNTSVDFLLN